MCKVVLLQFVLEWTLAVNILQSYTFRAWVILSHQLKSALTQLWILPLAAENKALSQYTRQTRTPYLSSNHSTETCMQRLTQSSVKQPAYNEQDMYEKRQLVSPGNWHRLFIKIPTDKLAPTSFISFPLTCLKPEQNCFPLGWVNLVHFLVEKVNVEAN